MKKFLFLLAFAILSLVSVNASVTTVSAIEIAPTAEEDSVDGVEPFWWWDFVKHYYIVYYVKEGRLYWKIVFID